MSEDGILSEYESEDMAKKLGDRVSTEIEKWIEV